MLKMKQKREKNLKLTRYWVLIGTNVFKSSMDSTMLPLPVVVIFQRFGRIFSFVFSLASFFCLY